MDSARRRTSVALKVVLVLVASVVFGTVFAAVKGTGGGWHIVFGNLSAPWLVLPVVTGAVASRRAVIGAMLGGCAAMLSLVAFYATISMLWDMVNVHTVRNDVTFVVGGTLGAAIVTAVSGRVRGRGKVAMIGLLFACEPAAWIAYEMAGKLPATTPGAVVVYAVEVTLGILALLAARSPRSAGTSPRRPGPA